MSGIRFPLWFRHPTQETSAAVLVYSFSISEADGSEREALGCIDLLDDDAARGFGDAVIRDMLRDSADQYTGWTLGVTQGERMVCRLAFPRPSRDRLRA